MSVDGRDMSIRGRGHDANGGDFEDIVAGNFGQENGVDLHVLYLVAIAQGFLIGQLNGKSLMNPVGNERADGFQILGGPSGLDFQESPADSLVKSLFVEGRIGGGQNGGGFGGEVGVHDGAAAADHAVLKGQAALGMQDGIDADHGNGGGDANEGVRLAE